MMDVVEELRHDHEALRRAVAEVEAILAGADTGEMAVAKCRFLMRVLEQFAIHRLPVVEHGRLVGVLSLKDIAVAADKRWAYPESRTAEEKLGEIIEAIASSR